MPNEYVANFSAETYAARLVEQNRPDIARQWTTHVRRHDGAPYPSRCYWCARVLAATEQ